MFFVVTLKLTAGWLLSAQIKPPVVQFERQMVGGSLIYEPVQQGLAQPDLGQLLKVAMQNYFADELRILLRRFEACGRLFQASLNLNEPRRFQPFFRGLRV